MSTRKKPLTAVDIAKDVIALIAAKKIRVKKGTYGRFARQILHKHEGESVQKVLQEATKPICNVCAMGAMFCAFIDKENEVKVKDYDLDYEAEFGNEYAITQKLAPYFSENQLRLIEAAFEGVVIRDLLTDDYDIYERAAIQFFNRYKNPEARLVAIMENVIANKGKFNPPVTLEPLN